MDNLSALDIPIIKTPDTPPAKGRVSVYFKKNGLLYKMNSGGVESLVEEVVISGSNTVNLTNQSAITLQPGMIVVVDKTAPLSCTTTIFQFSYDAIGIVKVGGTPGQQVTIQFGGVIDVITTGIFGAVNVGDFLFTSGTPGIATAFPSAYPGAIARTLTPLPYGSNGIVTAILSGGLPELF